MAIPRSSEALSSSTLFLKLSGLGQLEISVRQLHTMMLEYTQRADGPKLRLLRSFLFLEVHRKAYEKASYVKGFEHKFQEQTYIRRCQTLL